MKTPLPASSTPQPNGIALGEATTSSPPQAAVLNTQPPAIPDHELLRRIGGGSYGEVWLARNALGAYRAVKIVHRHTFEDDRPFEREFAGIQKFEPVSRLHEGLVDLLQVGRNDAAGYFYYVMELADDANAECGTRSAESAEGAPGIIPHSALRTPHSYTPRTLRSLLRPNHQPSTLNPQPTANRLPFDECVRLGLSLANALAYLHGQGLVHRDIKPSNIIFVGGVPKLADVGLVTGVDEARSYVGTEGFIPPEGPGSPQADIYSLGKVLYEAAMGRSRLDFPALPADWDALESAEQSRLLELNEVLVRACVGDVRKRHANAQVMLSDLELLQRGESVKRRRAMARRWVLAKNGVLSLAAVAVLAVGAWALSTKLVWRSPDATRSKVSAKNPPSPEVIRLCKLGGEAEAKGTKESLTEAFELLNRAIVLDPGYVPAYLGLASAYNAAPDWLLPSRQALPEVKRAASSALQINPSSAGALQWLGVFKMEFEWDWAGAEADFKRAIQLGPKEPWPHTFYAILLLNMKRLPEARVEQERALAQAPNNPTVINGMVSVYFAERRFEEALELALKGRREHPNTLAFRIWLAWIYEQKGMYPEAIAELRAARAIDDGPDFMAFLGYLYAANGDKERARELLKKLQGMSGRLVPQYYVALVHVGLGDSDAAIGCLQKAVVEKSASLTAAAPFLPIAIDPHFDSLRADPRFTALLRQMGLEK